MPALVAMRWSHCFTSWVRAEGTVPASQSNAVRQRDARASPVKFPDRLLLFRFLFPTEGAYAHSVRLTPPTGPQTFGFEMSLRQGRLWGSKQTPRPDALEVSS